MVRRYDDRVDVRVRPAGEDAEGRPDAFLWHDRLYVVQAVLDRWRERRAWWQDAAASAVHGEGEVSPRAPGERAAGEGTATAVLSREHEVWRVEASAGCTRRSGVYDLCQDTGPSDVGRSDLLAEASTWRLRRVVD